MKDKVTFAFSSLKYEIKVEEALGFNDSFFLLVGAGCYSKEDISCKHVY